RNLIARLEREGTEVEVHVVGRKGLGYFRYVGRAVASERTDVTDRPTADDAVGLSASLTRDFAAGALDAVYVVQARFVSALSTPPATVQVLPVTPPNETGKTRDFILAPSAEAI